MALKVKGYELPNGDILPEAYLRVQNIIVENRDYEYFDSSNKPDVELELKWITRIEVKATVFVWADEIARQNRAIAMQGFVVETTYNLSEYANIFEQIYQTLAVKFPNSENY